MHFWKNPDGKLSKIGATDKPNGETSTGFPPISYTYENALEEMSHYNTSLYKIYNLSDGSIRITYFMKHPYKEKVNIESMRLLVEQSL